MPRSFRSNKKSPPQKREVMKKAEKQEPKSLADICKERTEFLKSARQQKEDAKKRERDRQLEDEVMVMTYGPNWKAKWHAEQIPEKVVIAKPEEEDPDDKYADYIPDDEESGIRLKAS